MSSDYMYMVYCPEVSRSSTKMNICKNNIVMLQNPSEDVWRHHWNGSFYRWGCYNAGIRESHLYRLEVVWGLGQSLGGKVPDFSPSRTTVRVRWCNKSAVPSRALLLTQYTESLSRRCVWETIPNELAKSVIMISVWTLLLTSLARSWIKKIVAFLKKRNPCCRS